MSLEFVIGPIEKQKFCDQVVVLIDLNDSEALVLGLFLGASELVRWLVGR